MSVAKTLKAGIHLAVSDQVRCSRQSADAAYPAATATPPSSLGDDDDLPDVSVDSTYRQAPLTVHADAVEHLAREKDPLSAAFALDAPIDFIARDAVQMLARLPMPFSAVLPLMERQLAFRQRQAALASATAPTSSSASSAAASSSSGIGGIASVVQQLLPIAVGRTRACKTAMRHDVEGGNTSKNAMPNGNTTTTATAVSGDGAFKGKQVSKSPTEEREEVSLEERAYRAEAADAVLTYLFRSPSEVVVVDAAEGEDGLSEEMVTHRTTISACFSGVRELPPDSAEYLEVLRRVVKLDGARRRRPGPPPPPPAAEDGEEEGGETADLASPAAPVQLEAGVELHVPAYVRHLLAGDSQERERKTRDPASPPPPKETQREPERRPAEPSAAPAVERTVEGEGEMSTMDSDEGIVKPITSAEIIAAATTTTSTLASGEGAPARLPVVTSNARTTLDTVLPPRLLLFYAVDREAAADVQGQRAAAQARIASLRAAIASNSKDTVRQTEMEALSKGLSDELDRMPVGEVLLLVERTSDAHAPRAYLTQLETTLEDLLRISRARTCGRPLRVSACVKSAQAPHRPVESVSATQLKRSRAAAAVAAAAAAKTKTLIVATPAGEPVCTRTVRPPPAHAGRRDGETAASASVLTTLNVTELSTERHLILFHALGAELLRQVAVDLPERGVLLRRVLNEARLSLDARATVAKAQVTNSAEHLGDGEEEREAHTEHAAELTKEVAALRARLTSLRSQQSALTVWAEERRTRAAQAAQRSREFQKTLVARLTVYTATVTSSQEQGRAQELGPAEPS